jgi:amidohydrolase
MKSILKLIVVITLFSIQVTHADTEIDNKIKQDYDDHLFSLFKHFHTNPELSLAEHKTAARIAKEIRAVGFKVTEGVGGTGLVAIMENGPGPMVMMRADMDGLPVEEKSGLEFSSRTRQVDPVTGNEAFVMHACGHDVHITSLIGTARRMAELKDQWSGTLMLIGQPAEERIIGARMMMEDNLWKRFGTPDYGLAFHVASENLAGTINVSEGSPYAGSDSVDIIIHGVGAHGAHPHTGKDPIVLGSQIVLALQTLVSRELAPRDSGVVTVGAFHSGTKHNIISDRAELQLTVRNTNPETRKLLLDGIKRIAENMGRAAGLPEDKLPEVIYSKESVPPTINDVALVRRLKSVWTEKMGTEALKAHPTKGMGAEDYPFFTTDPYIPSAYFRIGGTTAEDFALAANGGPAIPSHHSPIFKITPEPAIINGIRATVYALLDLMPAK